MYKSLVKNPWLWLFLLALLARALADAATVEAVYSRALFPTLRLLQGWISVLSPVPLIYLLLAGLLLILLRRRRKAILPAIFFLLFTFLLLWGFNYQRLPFAEQAGLKVAPLDEEALQDEFAFAMLRLLEARDSLHLAPEEAVSGFYSFGKLEKILFPAVQGALRGWGYPSEGRVRARMLYPKGILMRFGSSGVYLPWTGEGHVDAGQHPLNWPFVMAHEMSHGYGIADEGVCNFLAYQVCSSHPDSYVRYAGALYYWRYASSALRRACPAEWETAVEALPKGVKLDLKAIRENSDRYPDFIPQWRDVVYDSFLKSQGLREGVLSYDNILALARAWRQTQSY
jgi:hypothetical protein